MKFGKEAHCLTQRLFPPHGITSPEHSGFVRACYGATLYAEGNMQLYSVAQERSQALEAHAAAFSTHQVPGNAVKSQIVAFAQKTLQPDGQITSKLHVIELGAQAAGFLCDAPFPYTLFQVPVTGTEIQTYISPCKP